MAYIEPTSRTNFVIQPGQTREEAEAQNNAYWAMVDAGYDPQAAFQQSRDPAAANAVLEAQAEATRLANTHAPGSTYEMSLAESRDPLMDDRRNYMLGRDPNYANNVARRAADAGYSGATQQRQIADAAVGYGIPASQAAAQQAIDTAATARGNAQNIQNRGDELAQYGVGQAQQVSQAGQNLTALGGQYAGGLQNAGAAAQQYGTAAASGAKQAGLEANRAVSQAGGQAARQGSVAADVLTSSGRGVAQAASSLGANVSAAGGTAMNATTGVQRNLDTVANSAEGVGRTSREQLNRAGVQGSELIRQAGGGVQQDAYGRASGVEGTAATLAGLEAQQGPSAAQAQLQAGTNKAMATQLAMARSGRGLGGNAAALDNAQRNMAGIQADAGNQAAILRAQEDAAWRQRAAANYGTAGQLQSTAGQLALSGGLANLNAEQAGAQTNIAALQAGSNAALQGLNQSAAARGAQGGLAQGAAGQNIGAQQAAAQIGMTGQQANLSAIQAGQQINQQGQALNLQGVSQGAGYGLQGTQMGINAAQQGYGQNLQAQQAAAQYGIGAAQAGAGLQANAAALGIDATQAGAGIYTQGAQYGSANDLAAQQAYLAAAGYGTNLLGQQGQAYGAATGLEQAGIGQELGVMELQQRGNLAWGDAATRRLAIQQGAAEAEAQARNQYIGYGLQAGAIAANALS